MFEKTDWGKRHIIAVYIGILIAIVLAIVQEVWPPDPQHPMRLDFLSKSIVLPPWLVILALVLTIFGTAGVVRWVMKKSDFRVQSVKPAPTPEIPVKLEMHPTSLDPRSFPHDNVHYTAKLRISFENKGDQVVRVLPPRWLTTGTNISVQCGASPYPGVPYQVGMSEFGSFYQLEEYQGSWKLDRWKRKPNSDPDEQKEINVDPRWTFRIWIGLNPCVPHNILEAKRKTHQLGTLILPLIIGNQECEWTGEV